MLLELSRRFYLPGSTIGDLRVDGQLFCQVLEPVLRSRPWLSRTDRTAVPAGCYELVITYSLRCRRSLPLLLGVPGCEDVRLGWGTTGPVDAPDYLRVGCYNPRWPGRVSASRATFDRLFPRLETAFQTGEPLRLTFLS